MIRSRQVTAAATGLLLLCMAGSAVLLRQVDQVRTAATLQDVLYVSSQKLLKRLSLGYEGLLADIYWTRTVQYFGRKHMAYSDRYDLLAPLLEITTALDPHLIVAYQFGSSFLAPPPPDGAGMPERAIQLVEYGIRNNPDDWKLYSDLGFIYYMDKKDYAGAAIAFDRGSKVPNAHPFMKIMAAQMAQHAGELETARMLWVTTYQTTEDRQIRANALSHLRALRVDEDVNALESAVARYGQQTGHLPPSISVLVAAGILTGIPIDPDGHPYRLMPDGRIEVRQADDFPFVQKGLPLGYKAPA